MLTWKRWGGAIDRRWNNANNVKEASLKSKRVLRTGIMTCPYLKTYEINTGIQSYVVDIKDANKQFSFIETLLVYDKSGQHNTLYDLMLK